MWWGVFSTAETAKAELALARIAWLVRNKPLLARPLLDFILGLTMSINCRIAYDCSRTMKVACSYEAGHD